MLHELNHPSVRDLAWCFLSPALLARDALPEFLVADQLMGTLKTKLAPQLRQLDKDPSELEAFLQSRPTRQVGRYFEHLVEFGLSISGVQLLATNHQLHQGKRVIGELDYLFEHEEQVEHWETAIKFYLQHDNSMELNQFIGPKASDNLELKLSRILEHQLPMGQHPITQEVSGVQGRSINSRAFVRGCLFYRSSTEPERRAPSPVSPSHLTGWWRYAHESPLPQSSPDHAWFKADKPNWLAPLRLTHSPTLGLITPTEVEPFIDHHFANEAYPLLMVEVQRVDNRWEEVSRGFIVKSSWPNNERPVSSSGIK